MKIFWMTEIANDCIQAALQYMKQIKQEENLKMKYDNWNFVKEIIQMKPGQETKLNHWYNTRYDEKRGTKQYQDLVQNIVHYTN